MKEKNLLSLQRCILGFFPIVYYLLTEMYRRLWLAGILHVQVMPLNIMGIHIIGVLIWNYQRQTYIQKCEWHYKSHYFWRTVNGITTHWENIHKWDAHCVWALCTPSLERKWMTPLQQTTVGCMILPASPFSTSGLLRSSSPFSITCYHALCKSLVVLIIRGDPARLRCQQHWQ